MGRLRKLVAAAAAIPMLTAMVPAANAVESSLATDRPASQSAQAQQALEAALKSNAKTETTVADTTTGTTDYLFAHFTGTEGSQTDEQIYFATSQDGLAWHDTRDSGDPVLSWNDSQTGNSRGKDNGVRDPYLVRSPKDGKVYLIATELSIHNRGGWGAAAATTTGSTNLIIWESTDLVNWSAPRAVDVASKIPGAGMAWAPEAYWDDAKDQFMVYWATASDQDNESGDRTNMYYATTKDFVTFSDPIKWIDRSKSVIDTTMLKADDGYYYRVSGDTYLGIERSKDPYATTVTTGNGLDDGYYNTGDDPEQWTLVGTFGDLTGTGLTGAQLEGPELFFYNSDDIQTNAAGKQMKYGLMWDQYSSGKGYTPYRSADLGSSNPDDWGFASDVNFGSLKKRHGTILPITSTEYDAVLKTFDKNRAADPVEPDADGSAPIAEYTFEDGKGTDGADGKHDLTFNGNAKVSEDADRGNVLTLDGSNGTYAQFPKGLFDGRNKLTVQMDVKSETAANTNQFTFAFGKNNQKYYFMKYNKGTLANRITTGSYGAESKADSTLDGAWHQVTVVFDGNTMTSYVDGKKAAENTATSATVADLGIDLTGYLGKSFYNDPYFKGAFDNIKIWNRALSAGEIAGETPEPSSDVLADLTFDDLKDGATGAVKDAASNATATIEGKAATGANDKNGTTAAKVGKDFWLNVTKSDGTPLLKGVTDLTVSFDAKPDNGNPGWAFYAAPNANAPQYNKSEHYLGVMAKPGTVNVERYNTDGNRDTRGNASGSAPSDGWYNVTVTADGTATRVYVDGVLASESTNVKGLELPAILGEGGGILQLGKANWGSGEYYAGLLDNVKVWNRTLSEEEIAKANNVALTLASATVGTVPADPNSLRGTDDHSNVRTTLDKDAKTITSVINRRGDASKLPVTLKATYAGATFSVDGQPFTSGDTLDLTKDRALTIAYTDESGQQQTQEWTLKAATVGNNPVLPGQYADPDIDYFDGKFWIFPTTDGFSGWSGNYFHAFSSTDLVNWTDEGVILDVNKDHQPTTDGDADTAISPWSTGSAWAPTIQQKVVDGQTRYFFYYCAKKPGGESAIGVAWATNPAGPYTAADQPVVTRSMEGVTVGQAIDPSIFTDPKTGKSYILYGNGSPAIAELSDDMMSVKTGTVKKLEGLRNFRESVVVAYRDGKYHWTWSCDDANSPNYHVEYGVSDSIDGTIEYKGVLLQKDSSKNLQGTAHQSDVHVTDADGNDRWFMAYHRHYTPLGVFTSGLGYHRETAIDEIHFGEDGLMQTIYPSDEGVSITMANVTALDSAIEAAAALGDDGSAYTEDSWKAFTDAREAAAKAKQTFLDSGLSQVDVDAAASALTKAQGALEKNQPEPEHPAAGTLLSIAVDATQAKGEYKVGEQFVADGLVVTATVADGQGGQTTRELDASEYQVLGFDASKAVDPLVLTVQAVADPTLTATFNVKVVESTVTPPPTTPDLATKDELAQLADAVAKAESAGLKQSDYTVEAWKAYADALANAKAVLAKGSSATSTEVKDAIRHLDEARKGLEKAEAKAPQGGLSNTGAAVAGIALAAVVLAVGAAGVMLAQRRGRCA